MEVGPCPRMGGWPTGHNERGSEVAGARLKTSDEDTGWGDLRAGKTLRKHLKGRRASAHHLVATHHESEASTSGLRVSLKVRVKQSHAFRVKAVKERQ